MKKKILFVINTLGHAGAEVALSGLLNALDKTKYDISLYVLLGQGELMSQIPPEVKILNKKYNELSVLCAQGKHNMMKTVLNSCLSRATIIIRFTYIIKYLFKMIKKKQI